MYEYKRKNSVIYVQHGAKIECPFWTMAGVGLDIIRAQTDQEIRDALKLALFSPELHDKHINVERSNDEIVAYTTGSNLTNSRYRGCIIRWHAA